MMATTITGGASARTIDHVPVAAEGLVGPHRVRIGGSSVEVGGLGQKALVLRPAVDFTAAVPAVGRRS